MKKILIVMGLILLDFSAAMAQQPTLWQSLPLGFNNSPTHILNDSAHEVAYLYGFFDKVGSDTCNIIRMDSSGFTLMPYAPVDVYSGITAALNHGKLYVSGSYSDIFSWNGSTWDSIPVSGNIACLYSHNNKLYVCGSFDSIAQIHADNLAVWNDTTWVGIPGVDTFLDMSNSLIYNIIWYKDELYVSGNFKRQGILQYLTLIRFDGQHWNDVDGQIAGNQGPGINDMLVWKDTLYVSGTFRESNGGAGNGIAKWDGQHWHSLQQGVFIGDQPTVSDMMVFNNVLYVAGWFNDINGAGYPNPYPWTTGLAKWDGTQWCSLGVKVHGALWNLGQFRDSLYVMGQFDTLNNQPIKYMAKWIGGDYTDSCMQQPTGIVPQPGFLQTTLNLFPNPARRILNIQYHNPLANNGKGVLIVRDVLGKLTLSKNIKIKQGENFWKLNTAAIPPGVYLLEIRNGERKSRVKFEKQ